MYVVNASLQDRTSIDNSSTGGKIRYRREQQAEQLTTQILEPLQSAGDHVLVLGGFDSFEFSDGYVDTLGILDGLESSNTSSGSLVTLYDSAYNSSELFVTTTSATNLTSDATNPSTSRYTYVESGSAEQPDHILSTTSELSDYLSIDYARIGADFPVSLTYTTSTVARASSHDGVIGYFTVPYPTKTTISSHTPNPSYYDEGVAFTVSICAVDSSDTSTCVSSAGVPSSGTVEILDGSTVVGTGTVDSGTATITVSSLSVGTHSITAYFEGYDNGSIAYEASTSAAVSQEVDKDDVTLTLSASPAPSYSGETATFSVSAASSNGAGGSGATPTGTVTFTDTTTGTTLGSATLSSGSASVSAALTEVETHVIKASYGGDDTDNSATGTLNQVVLPTYATVSTLTCTPNPAEYATAVTCTDTVTAPTDTDAPTPGSGTVTFYDGSTSLGSVSLSSGTATYSTSSLKVGSHNITAVYALNYPYLASTSNVVAEIIVSTYTMTAKPASASIYTGESVTSTITIVPGDGFDLDVALTCSGQPTNSTCTITPSTVSGGSGTAKVVLQTTAPSQTTTTTARLNQGGRGWPLLAGLLLLFVPKRFRRRGLWAASLLLTAALAAITLGGCSSAATLTGGTPAGTYSIVVTGKAIDGTLTITKTATVTVTVKSMF
jgi:hypothetical protein